MTFTFTEQATGTGHVGIVHASAAAAVVAAVALDAVAAVAAAAVAVAAAVSVLLLLLCRCRGCRCHHLSVPCCMPCVCHGIARTRMLWFMCLVGACALMRALFPFHARSCNAGGCAHTETADLKNLTLIHRVSKLEDLRAILVL